MKVKLFEKEWDIKKITYAEKRKLWQCSIKAFPDGVVNQDAYFELIEKVEILSGLTEKDYINKDNNPLTMAEIDLLLQEVFAAYMGIEKKD